MQRALTPTVVIGGAIFLTACGGSSSTGTNTVRALDGDEFAELEVPPGSQLQLLDMDGDRRVDLRVTGDFSCAGEIEIAEAVDDVVITVGGDLSLSCPLGQQGLVSELPEEVPEIEAVPSTIVHFIVDGVLNTEEGFNPFFGGALLITDDLSDPRPPEAIIAELFQDDGESPTFGIGLVPPPDVPAKLGAEQSKSEKQGVVEKFHTLRGEWGKPGDTERLKNSGVIEERFSGVFISVGVDLVYEMDYFAPDRRGLPPVTETSPLPGSPLEPRGSKGVQGSNFALSADGEILVNRMNTIYLGLAGEGQGAVARGGRPAVSHGGDGGDVGRVALRARRGFTFGPEGSFGIIADAGNGGFAIAEAASVPPESCGDLAGGNAFSFSGDGGDARMDMTLRSVSRAVVLELSVSSGIPGVARAFGGNGQRGCDEPFGHGGRGGNATMVLGDSGDAVLNIVGNPDFQTPEGFSARNVHWDGNATAGSGGAGGTFSGDCPRSPRGGNGGAGGRTFIGGGSRGLQGTERPVPLRGARSHSINPGQPGACGNDGGRGAASGGFEILDSYQQHHPASSRLIPNPSIPPNSPNCPCPSPTGTIVQPPPTEEPTPTPIITGEPTPAPTPTPTPTAEPTEEPTPTPIITGEPTPTPTPTPTGVAACAGQYVCTGCRFPGDPADEIRLSPVPDQPNALFIENLDGNDSPLLFIEDAPPGSYDSERNDLSFFGSPDHVAQVVPQKDDSGRPMGMQWFVQTNDATGSCTMSCSFVGP